MVYSIRAMYRKVHPRIRGEYILADMMRIWIKGSPPHTRGIQINILECRKIRRFTPAYAGNTQRCNKRQERPWVHPRIRGEYRSVTFTAPALIGSPPHTRGIPGKPKTDTNQHRFTPAYAGNT